MKPDAPSRQMFQFLWPGGLIAQAIYVAARLGVADRISEEPRSAMDLAGETGSHVDALERVLRSLSCVGIFEEDETGCFAHTPLSETLRRDHPQSTRAWAVFLGTPWIWRPWGELLETVRTGEPGFERLFGDFYRYMSEHPDDAAIYDEAMSSGSAMTVEQIVGEYDFSGFSRIVDVGGGQGELLKGILEANRRANGVLQDLPRVVEGAKDLTSGELADRCEVIGRDFWEGVPVDGDAYLLKGIVHGMDDENALRLLKLIRSAIRDEGRLLILEAVPQGRQEANPQKAFMDLMMLALVRGRERTEEQLRQLLARAGFELTRVVRTEMASTIVEARPA